MYSIRDLYGNYGQNPSTKESTIPDPVEMESYESAKSPSLSLGGGQIWIGFIILILAIFFFNKL